MPTVKVGNLSVGGGAIIMSELLTLASNVNTAKNLGADEVSVSIARGSHTTLTLQRWEIEQASEASTQGYPFP